MWVPRSCLVIGFFYFLEVFRKWPRVPPGAPGCPWLEFGNVPRGVVEPPGIPLGVGQGDMGIGRVLKKKYVNQKMKKCKKYGLERFPNAVELDPNQPKLRKNHLGSSMLDSISVSRGNGVAPPRQRPTARTSSVIS